jgi:hypothetical protein
MGEDTSNTGLTVLTVLTLIFITLKLTGILHWSWWWILCPVIFPFAVITLLFICAAIYIEIYIPLFHDKKNKKNM